MTRATAFSGQARGHTHHPLWLALRLPDLPLDALVPTAAPGPEQPVLISQQQKVFYACALARAAGVSRGMNLTTATMLCGAEPTERDEAAENALLYELASALYAFTPYIKLQQTAEHSGLLLELSRCLKLFKGLRPLCEQVFAVLTRWPLIFQRGLAHTEQGAWLLSPYDYPVSGDETHLLFQQRLYQVPVQQLSHMPKAVATLHNSGFKTLGDVAGHMTGQSIRGMRTRLGEAHTRYLCEALAIEQAAPAGAKAGAPGTSASTHAPPAAFHPAEPFIDSVQFERPLQQAEHIQPFMLWLLQRLSAYLKKHQKECQQIEWRFLDIYGNPAQLLINSDQPQSHESLLYELSCLKLAHNPPPFETDTLELHCVHATAISTRQQPLLFYGEHKASTQQEFSLTLARLEMIAGEQSVYKLAYEDNHIPERSNRRLPPHASSQASTKSKPNSSHPLPPIYQPAQRPAWLLPVAQTIQQKNNGLYWHGHLRVLQHTERLASHWWERTITRDYFVAQREDRILFWIYQDRQNQQWYIHGVFA